MPIAQLAALIDEKYIQYGFGGIVVILIGVVVWLIKSQNRINAGNQKTMVEVINENKDSLVDVIQKNNKVLAKLIDTIKSAERTEEQTRESVKELTQTVTDMKEQLLARPCLRRENNHVG